MRSASLELTKFVFAETVGSVIRFPIWWYGEGLSRFVGWIGKQLSYRWKSFSFVIWMQNLLVPMYGQYDLAGRLVSFVMRLVVLIGRGIFISFEAVGYLILLFAYAIVPPISFLIAAYSLLAFFAS
jgi:hypothetical protein